MKPEEFIKFIEQKDKRIAHLESLIGDLNFSAMSATKNMHEAQSRTAEAESKNYRLERKAECVIQNIKGVLKKCWGLEKKNEKLKQLLSKYREFYQWEQCPVCGEDYILDESIKDISYVPNCANDCEIEEALK